MANEIRGGGGVHPGQIPVQNPVPTPKQTPTQVPTSLQEHEAAKTQQQQVQKASAQDAARIAQQAGFQRTGQKKRAGDIDIGDSSRVPIPLPEEESQGEGWDFDVLDKARENFTMAASHCSDIAKDENAEPMAETLLSSSFMPTDEGTAKLQLILDREPPPAVPMEEASGHLKSFFDIQLPPEVATGHRLLALGLTVAGEVEAIEVTQGSINERRLAGGVQKVAERSNQAIGEAQKMSKGVSRELNLQRTFVFKR